MKQHSLEISLTGRRLIINDIIKDVINYHK